MNRELPAYVQSGVLTTFWAGWCFLAALAKEKTAGGLQFQDPALVYLLLYFALPLVLVSCGTLTFQREKQGSSSTSGFPYSMVIVGFLTCFGILIILTSVFLCVPFQVVRD